MNEGKKPVLLVIRDGWGANHHTEQDAYNAIKLADTPISDNLSQNWPRTELAACGLDVGVPPSVMGNSEVGHQNIGAGRIVDQEIVRINKAFETGSIRGNKVLEGAFDRAKGGGKLHYMGIVSDAGCTASWSISTGYWEKQKTLVSSKSTYTPLQMAATLHRTAVKVLSSKSKRSVLNSVLERSPVYVADSGAWIVTTAGSEFPKPTICSLAKSAEGTSRRRLQSPIRLLRKSHQRLFYRRRVCSPTWVVDETGQPVATIGNGDAVVFYNYRGDRPEKSPELLSRTDSANSNEAKNWIFTTSQ